MSSGIARKFTDLMHQEPVVMWSCMIGALGEFFLRLLLLPSFFFFLSIFKCFLSLLTTRVRKAAKSRKQAPPLSHVLSALLTPPLSYFLLSFLFFLSRRVAASVQTGLALPLIVPPIRESFETKPTRPLQPMKVRAGERFLFWFWFFSVTSTLSLRLITHMLTPLLPAFLSSISGGQSPIWPKVTLTNPTKNT